MIPFLVQEGAITAAAFTGIFTAGMLGSLKANVIEPFTERVLPAKHLDKHADGSESPINKPPSVLIVPSISMFGKTEPNQQQSSSQSSSPPPVHPKVRWQTFLRDFTAWLLVMFIFYLIWKHFFHPYKVAAQQSMKPPTNVGGMFNVQNFVKRN